MLFFFLLILGFTFGHMLPVYVQALKKNYFSRTNKQSHTHFCPTEMVLLRFLQVALQLASALCVF